MSSAPFNVDLVITRLLAQVPDLRRVRGAADYAAVTSLQDFQPPEAFVVPARERGAPNAGSSRQAVQAYFGVVVVVRNYKEQRGKPSLDDATPLIGRTRDALIGWIPADAAGNTLRGGRGCQWVQGDVMDYDASTLLWSDVYQTQHFIGSTSP